MEVNSKFNEQKYFENIRKYTKENLSELVFHKLEYAKTKFAWFLIN